MLYGFFLKVVIADRATIAVDAVYDSPDSFPGWYIVFATLLFSIQIYCDFYGYSTIAKGVALTMGVKLMDNFNAPYYSRSIKEFWRRWHISLSTWFRDYLYIPLGGNRKGKVRKYVNLMIVFAVSGLWHGASISFVVWGILHGLYQLLESFISHIGIFLKERLNKEKSRSTFTDKLFMLILTFILVAFAWLFFRANSMSKAQVLLEQMVSAGNWTVLFDKSIFKLGISEDYFNVLLISIGLLALIDYHKYRGRNVVSDFFRQKWWFRTIAEVVLLLFVILFGCYGSTYDVQQFIYFQF